jgi:hypothetical protein
MAWQAGAAVVAAGVAAWSLTTLVNQYEGAVCNVDWTFLLLSATFSLSLIWIISEALIVVSATVFDRLLSRLPALLLGLMTHFLIGTTGWLLRPNVGYYNGGLSSLPEWIPMWIVGLLFKIGHLTTCQ